LFDLPQHQQQQDRVVVVLNFEVPFFEAKTQKKLFLERERAAGVNFINDLRADWGAQIPKVKKGSQVASIACAFGICACKSCS